MTRAYTRSIDDVRAVELEYIAARRKQDDAKDPPPPDETANTLVGVALSGGGIRSATTNLGILQALSQMGVLPIVDYLSTVSGGGYIGACLTSLLSINQRATDQPDRQFEYNGRDDLMFSPKWPTFPFNPRLQRSPGGCSGRQAIDGQGKRVVAHLRTHGNFLIAHRGLFQRDALRSVGNLLTGTVYHLLIVLLTLCVGAIVIMGTAHALGGDLPDLLRPGAPQRPGSVTTRIAPEGGGAAYIVTQTTDPELADQFAKRFSAAWDSAKTDLSTAVVVSWLAGGASVSLILLVLYLALLQWWQGPATWDPGDTREDKYERWVLKLTVVSLIGVLLGALQGATRPTPSSMAPLAYPFLFIAGARIGNFLLYPVMAMFDGAGLWTRRSRSLWGSYQAITTYGMAVMLLFPCLAVAAYAASDVKPWHLIAPAVSLVVGRLLVAGPVTRGAERAHIPRAALHFLLGVAVAVFIAFVMLEAAAAAVHWGFADPFAEATFYRPALGAAVVALLFLMLVGNINKISPHYFYRDRLIETYLRTEVAAPDGRMLTLRDTMEMRLQDLHGRDASGAAGNTSPYLLVSAAVNLAGSRDLTRKDRKSGYFLFSKYYCGSRQTGYRPTDEYRGGGTKLGRAVTISGAAASSAMGFHTFFAQSFFMTMFNLRLGYWIANPRWSSPRALGGWQDRVALWPAYLAREMFGLTSERTRLVNLSDGGHTGDNVGIYPLLERRCQVIIACDAERDMGLTFGSFTEALRHAYVDLGIDVDIDLNMLRPDPRTGYSKSHCAVGRIRYPECPERPNWLIYLKTSLTGDEPAPILNYKSMCPDFPHETTADQFFDDAQFESYRALGVHIAEDTFARWVADPQVATALLKRVPSP
ncbi:MAG: hypothetical protein HYS05_01800 [Acidobacteria bacterium]|nr:hypothetical protein [Acidobacteriota bacterium]